MSKPNATNGWRSGRDPVQRWLRIITTVVCLAVFTFLAIDQRSGPTEVGAGALALGAVLLLLGYEGIIRVPFIGREYDDRKEDDDR